MRILFESVHGDAQATADYAVHPAVRERAILYSGHMYEQNRQLPDGRWVYRATAPRREHDGDHAVELSGWKRPTSPDWDGPPPRVAEVPPVPELLGWFDYVLSTNAPIPPDAVRGLRDAVYATFKAWGRV